MLAISQSGQSPDIVAVVEAGPARRCADRGDHERPGSPLAAAAQVSLRIHAGRELAVPATKTYVAELAVVAALVNAVRPTPTLTDGLAALPDAPARHDRTDERVARRAGHGRGRRLRRRGSGARSSRAASTWRRRSSWR